MRNAQQWKAARLQGTRRHSPHAAYRGKGVLPQLLRQSWLPARLQSLQIAPRLI